MRTFIVIALTVLLVGCSGVQPEASSTPTPTPAPTPTEQWPTATFTGGPRIYFQVDSVDMGRVRSDALEDYEFHFKNIGDQPLEIVDTSTDALEGC